MRLRLYHYWRSSSSWRVRWALAIKGITAEMVPVDLLNGEVEAAPHLARNPAAFVPVLEFLDGPLSSDPRRRYLTESVAIIEWLEELQPAPTLLPGDAFNRARARQLAGLIYAGVQPLQNPNVMEMYSPSDPEKRKAWSQHWIRNGFRIYEEWVKSTAGRFSVGDSLSLADLCLIPQCYNANRFEVSLDEFPTIARINQEALALETCQASAPDKYGDPKPPL